MSFTPLAVDWLSHVPGAPPAGGAAPAQLSSPATPWEFGASTQALAPGDQDGVLRLTLQVTEGSAGFAISALNYGALLTEEAIVTPDDGVTTRVFAFPSRFGACRVVLRTYGDGGAVDATILAVETAQRSELSEAERAAVIEAAARTDFLPVTDELRTLAASPHAIFTPVSLGGTCEAKFQIARVLNAQSADPLSEMAFRLAMLPPHRAEDRFGWGLFDWQGTSLKAVRAYLERDFERLFERDDLQPLAGGVVHRDLRTQHVHDFEVLLKDPRATVGPAVLDEGYPLVRARFDAMIASFRKILAGPGPILYVHVCEDIPSEWDVHHLVEAIRRSGAPDHRFRLLFVGYEGSDSPWGDYAATIADKAFRPCKWTKPKGREWEGPDSAWDQALARYSLTQPKDALINA